MSEITADGLAQVAAEHPFAYLLTVTADGRPHAVEVRPTVTDGVVHLSGLGSRSRANVLERPAVSILWPPREVGGYSLIVDGEAELDGEALRLTPSRAVRHRPQAGADGMPDGACGSDCLPVDLDATSASG